MLGFAEKLPTTLVVLNLYCKIHKNKKKFLQNCFVMRHCKLFKIIFCINFK